MRTFILSQILHILFFICLITSCADESRKFFDLAMSKASRGDYEGAILDFNKVLELNPSFYDCYYERGMAKFNSSDYKGAIEDMSIAINNNKTKLNNASTYFARAKAKARIGDFFGAISDYDSTLLVNKNFPPIVYAYRGATKHILGDQIGAKADIDKADSLGYVPYIPTN